MVKDAIPFYFSTLGEKNATYFSVYFQVVGRVCEEILECLRVIYQSMRVLLTKETLSSISPIHSLSPLYIYAVTVNHTVFCSCHKNQK